MKIKILIVIIFLISCQKYHSVSIENTKITNYLQSFSKSTPGVAVLVIKNQKTLFKGGFGLANLSKNENINENTIFEIGSIGKVFTGHAILKLLNENLISMEDFVSKYLPELTFLPKKMKIKHLVYHASNLPDYLNDRGVDLNSKVNNSEKISNKYVLNWLKDKKIDKDKIGTIFAYSNTDYVLLSIIIEKISKMSYAKYMNKIFKEAQMIGAKINSGEENTNKFDSKSYSEWPFFKELKNKYNYTTTGDFGVQVSLNDFEKWIQYITKNHEKYWDKYQIGGIFDDNTKIHKKNTKTSNQISYGYGIRFGYLKGNWYIYHRGYINGASNILIYYPPKNVFVVVMSNTSSTFVDNIAIDIVNLI